MEAMKLFLTLGALTLAALATTSAQAVGRLADVSVIDRASGRPLPLHYHRGEVWVAGAPGGKYAIQIRSREGARLLAVTAVDGVNVLTGDTAGWDQSGYVFAPYQSYAVSGWRKSNQEVAAFEFTASPNSYAERTGRPANLGVIGVALFREKAPEPAAPPVAVWPAPVSPYAGGRASDSSTERGLAREGRAEAQGAPAAAAAAPAPAAKLGTGHGERESSYVTRTEFARAQLQPNEVIRIRYDSRDNLLALGVIRPEPLPSAVPNAFPESAAVRYVPDPPPVR